MSPIVLSSMLVVANIMGAGMIVPQVVRLRRYRNTRGISASWIGVGPVSYTHLDVYKRQAVQRPPAGGR